MRRAIALAVENVLTVAGGPFAAVIVRDGKIVGEGVNTVTRDNDPTAHGEVNAIRNACRSMGTFVLTGCEIYSSCEPCPMCLAAIYWAHMDAIYYGSTSADAARVNMGDAFLYREVALPHEARQIPSQQLLGPEAWAVFQAWIDSPGRIEY
jgi:tRNA(Arg) A34 adenosine deaminase TadA